MEYFAPYPEKFGVWRSLEFVLVSVRSIKLFSHLPRPSADAGVVGEVFGVDPQ